MINFMGQPDQATGVGAQIFGYTLFLGVFVWAIWMNWAFESVDWGKPIALPTVVGLQYLKIWIERKNKDGMRKLSLFIWLPLNWDTGLPPLDSASGQNFHHRLSQVLSLHNHVSQYLIMNVCVPARVHSISLKNAD